MFDTHCHLNFRAFEEKVEGVIDAAKNAGVNYFVVPGTDIETSKKAIEIAEKFDGVWAAVGIHPHHVYQIYQKAKRHPVQDGSPEISPRVNSSPSESESSSDIHSRRNFGSPSMLSSVEKLLSHPKVVAVGEIGLDRHLYQKTKYQGYKIEEDFINLQKLFFLEQLKLAKKYQKAAIIHNRQAKKDLLEILANIEYLISNIKMVFHCCEPDDDLLAFAISHQIYIGVDGDVTYPPAGGKKQEFVKKIPLELLVLETDSPFLTPLAPSLTRPGKDGCVRKTFPNEPKNLWLIAETIAKLKKISFSKLIEATTANAKRLFKKILKTK